MAGKPQLVSEMSFGGGLNLTSDPLHVKDIETTDCQNVDFDVRGAVKKRTGSISRTTDANSAADYVFPYNTPGGAARLIACRPGQVNKYIDSSYVLTAPAGTPGAQTAATTHSGVSAGGKAYVVNNSDATWKFDGTTATRLGTTAGTTGNQPKARYVVFYKGRLFFGNCNAGANRSRVIYTGSDANPADLEYFKATSFIDFDPDDGDEVTALVPFLDQIIVFKRNKTFSLRGDTPSSFRVVLGNPSLGCIAPRSAVAWEKGVVFLSSRGVFSFDGARAIRMSEKVDPALAALPVGTLSNAVGVVFGNRYFLALSTTGSTNDIVYVFDFTTGTWTRYVGWAARALSIWPRAGGDELWAVDDGTKNDYLQLLTGTADKGAAISAYFTTKWFDFGVPERKKLGKRAYLFFKASGNYNVSLDIQKDYQTDRKSTYLISLNPGGLVWNGGTWGGGVWGAGLDTIRKRITGIGTNASLRAKVYDTSTNPWTFEGMSFVLIPRNLA